MIAKEEDMHYAPSRNALGQMVATVVHAPVVGETWPSEPAMAGWRAKKSPLGDFAAATKLPPEAPWYGQGYLVELEVGSRTDWSDWTSQWNGRVADRLPTEEEWEYAARGGGGVTLCGDLYQGQWHVASAFPVRE